MIKFKVDELYSNKKIMPVEVVRETEKMVTYLFTWNGNTTERKELKDTQYHKYFDTWELAYAYLIYKAESSVSACETRLEQARVALETYKDMKP